MTKVTENDSLLAILGGRRAAIEATLPTVAFLLGWALSGGQIVIGGIAAIALGLVLACWSWYRGRQPRAVLVGLAGVTIAALIAMRTGRAADFFVLQILSNIASILIWLTSIVIKRPLLGVIVGTLLRQRGAWRRDPALARAYRRASFVWVGQYTIRVIVFGTLWLADQPIMLGVARLGLSWPLVAACIAVSWWVLKRSLPPGHPGIRHPVVIDSSDVPPEDPAATDMPGSTKSQTTSSAITGSQTTGSQITGSSRSSSNGVTRER